MPDLFLPEPELVHTEPLGVVSPPIHLRELDLGHTAVARLLQPQPYSVKAGELLNEHAVVLQEIPGERLVVGWIGRFWEEPPCYQPIDRAHFTRFSEPGWGRLVWSLRRDGESARVLLELRADATDVRTWDVFRGWLRTRLPNTAPQLDVGDVVEGVLGAIDITLDLLTPFLRGVRSHWGLTAEEAAEPWPGDDVVPRPRWSWTHAITIDAPPEAVWPWVVQIGADKAGFYSYAFLENLAGCNLENAEQIQAAWQQLRPGDGLVLHPALPPIPVLKVESGQWFVAGGTLDLRQKGKPPPWPFAQVSWLFLVEPHGSGSRLISRFRSHYSDDLPTRLQFGPYVTEAIGFAMDRRMLMGVKERVERSRDAEPLK